MQQKRRTLLCAVSALFVSAPMPSFSQNFPTKPLRWIVGYSAGSGLDFVARVVADTMSKHLHQQIIVENKPGAAGAISASALFASPSDGYTLLSADVGIYALNPHLYSRLKYDSPRDFKVVGMMVNIPMVLFVPSELQINTLEDFVNHIKSKPPGSVNFASSGIGNPTHLTMELFMRASKLKLTHVPYKGSPAALTDLATGQTSAFFVGPNDGMPHVKSGKLKVLATATPNRLTILPDVPTLNELGYDVSFQVAADTPLSLVDRLNEALGATMTDIDVIQRLEEAGFEVRSPTASRQADGFAKADYDRWGKFLPPLNIKLD